MDHTFVVTPDLTAARESLAVLDAAGASPTVAAMAFFPEYSDWRLVLAIPALDDVGQMNAYERVSEAWQGRFVYSLPPFMLFRTKDPFVLELRRIFRDRVHVGSGAVTRLGRLTIGGRYMIDSYVLRAKPMRGRPKVESRRQPSRVPVVAGSRG
jgi:hypothetical protein